VKGSGGRGEYGGRHTPEVSGSARGRGPAVLLRKLARSGIHVHPAEGRKTGVKQTGLHRSELNHLCIWVLVGIAGYIDRQYPLRVGRLDSYSGHGSGVLAPCDLLRGAALSAVVAGSVVDG